MIALADTLRAVAMALYAGIVVGALWVVLTYYTIYLREKNNWIGLLPKHVYLIGMSYLTYATGSIVWAFDKWNEPLGPLTIVNLAAGAVGVLAIKAMLQYQQKRMIP